MLSDKRNVTSTSMLSVNVIGRVLLNCTQISIMIKEEASMPSDKRNVTCISM